MRPSPHTSSFLAVLLSILLAGPLLPGPGQRAFAGGPGPSGGAVADPSPGPRSPAAAATEPPRGALDYASTHAPTIDELARRRARGDSVLLQAAVLDPLTEARP